MIWTIAVILLVVWLAGVFTHTLFPVVHVLLVVALVLIIVRLVKGKKAAAGKETRQAQQIENKPSGNGRNESSQPPASEPKK
jgi:hypothetical protein